MERNRKTTALVIAALVVSVISLGVAFAAFSSRLNINGTAKIAATTWNIHFSTTEDGDAPAQGGVTLPSGNISLLPSGTTTATSQTATLEELSFTWAATFKSAGDKVQYDFWVVNDGDYDAVLSNVVAPTITCKTGTSPNETTESNYCASIKYQLSHDSSGTELVQNGETLQSKDSAHIYVTAYLEDYTTRQVNPISTPPTEEIRSDAITTTLIYTQSGNAVTNSGNQGQ